MAKVVVQRINDTGDVQEELVLIEGATAEDAERVMSEMRDREVIAVMKTPVVDLVLEFHYRDGDVGAHPDDQVRKLWAEFPNTHAPSHIVIRPDTHEGQRLSDRLHRSGAMARALEALVSTINASGGVIAVDSGFAPAADEEWLDLGEVYRTACDALGVPPELANS